MSSITTFAEKFIWNNLKMALIQYESCLCDHLLTIANKDATAPIDRYQDFLNQLEAHIGLGSYVTQQATQFSNLPYITVNIYPYDLGSCNAKATVAFDVVFATDTPTNTSVSKNPGNSSEAVATFRANIIDALDQLMYRFYNLEEALETGIHSSPAFFDRLRDQELPSPTNPEKTKQWIYNIVGTVAEEKEVTEVIQLKREDRASGLSVFTVAYTIEISKLYGDDVDCGC